MSMATKSIAWNTGTGNITLTYQGQGNGTITVQSDENNLGSSRSQVISIQTVGGTVTKNLTVNQAACPFPVNTTKSYSYTGSYQEVELPAGKYKLQCWGAQGGSNGTNSSYGITAKAGGKGGYSEGIITLSSKTTVRVYVGGQGSSSAGGYNGGGSTSGSAYYSNADEYGVSRMGGGGGATDIRLSDGALLSRMIVAGGGAGGAMCYKKVTTTTTTWQTVFTGTVNSFYSSYYGRYIFYYEVTPSSSYLQNDVTYRLKSTAGNGLQIFLTDAPYGHDTASYNAHWDLSQNQEFTESSWNTTQGIYIRVTDKGSSSVVAGDTCTFTLQKKVTTTTTDTYNDYQVGGVGGGTQGGGYSSSYVGKQNAAGSGGSFGQGANQTATNYRYCSGAGGGGWYGGGGGRASDSSITYCKYSGGGSGFVNTAASAGNRPSGYTGLELDSGTTYAGNTLFPSTSGSTETGHSGDGYARITRLAVYNISLTFKTSGNEPIEGLAVTVAMTGGSTHSLVTNADGHVGFSDLGGTYTITCDGYNLSTSQFTVSANTSLDITAMEIYNFSYTGTVQSKTLGAGTYKIECWGAQGGSIDSTYYGGKGGYSVGQLTLSEDTTVYVYAGGQGAGGTTSGEKAGGFNGGGRSYISGSGYEVGSGGGASDIRIGQDSLYARIIVAGGGGGAGSYSSSYRYSGGAGGGVSGITPSQYNTSYKSGEGGSQTSRGTSHYYTYTDSTTYGTLADFGIGAGATTGKTYRVTGGGGGWYGGGSGGRAAGGGGSGYVYNASTASNYPSGCLLNSEYYLADAETKAGNTSIPSVSGSTETGHEGNGHVRITKL